MWWWEMAFEDPATLLFWVAVVVVCIASVGFVGLLVINLIFDVWNRLRDRLKDNTQSEPHDRTCRRNPTPNEGCRHV